MLRQRLSQSTAFDNPRLIYPKRTRHGYFKHQSDVRVREGGQSRRVTYGDPLQSMVVDESGGATVRMRGYTHLYRHREDARMCRPMLASLRTLPLAGCTVLAGEDVMAHVLCSCNIGPCALRRMCICSVMNAFCLQVKAALPEKCLPGGSSLKISTV